MQVRLVGEDGEMIGVVAIDDALKQARAKSLDLVEISPQAEPPVCKIMDFGKYKYDQKKRAQEAKSKQKAASLKEVKFRPNIGQNDFEVKLRQMRKFLEAGDKVKVTLRFKGREVVHNDVGMNLFARIQEELVDIAKTDIEPKLEGKQILMMLIQS